MTANKNFLWGGLTPPGVYVPLNICLMLRSDYYYFIIIITIVAKIKVTLSHRCCRGTVHKSLSQVGHWSNVSYTAAAAHAVMFSRLEKMH